MEKTLSLYYAAIAGLSVYFASTNDWPIAGIIAACYGSLALIASKSRGRQGFSTPIRLSRISQSLLIGTAVIAPAAYYCLQTIKPEPEAIVITDETTIGTVMNSIQLQYAIGLVHKSDPDFKLIPVKTAVPINPIATIVKDGDYEKVQEALQNQPSFEEIASKEGTRVITYGELIKELQRTPEPRILWFDPRPTRDTNTIIITDNLTD